MTKDTHSPIPVKSVKVSAAVKDFVARVKVDQRYKNEESQPLECTYIFPVELGAVIDKLEVRPAPRQVLARLERSSVVWDPHFQRIG